MFRTIIAALIALVLCADFLFAVNRKRLNPAELIVRAFMIIGYVYIVRVL